MTIKVKKEVARFRALAPQLKNGRRFGATTVRAEDASPVVGELYLYDVIGVDWFGGISSKSVVDAIRKCEADGATELRVYINSPGGDVFEGVAMHTAISRFKGKKCVFIDGLAASAASFIAMAGDEITVAPPAMLMIHDPYALVVGNAADMRKMADDLEKIAGTLVDMYVKRSGCSAEQVKDWMAAETWFTSQEAIDNGFADRLAEAAPAEDDPDGEEPVEPPQGRRTTSAAAASVVGRFKNTPEHLRRQAREPRNLLAAMEERTPSRRASPASTTPGQPGRSAA